MIYYCTDTSKNIFTCSVSDCNYYFFLMKDSFKKEILFKGLSIKLRYEGKRNIL